MKVYFVWSYCRTMGFPRWCNGKESTCQCKRCRRQGTGSTSWVRKIPWSRKWLPTSVFLPGKFHGQRSLAGYSLWGCKELNVHTHCCTTITLLPVLAVTLGIWSSDLPVLIRFWTMLQWTRISCYLNLFLKKNLKCELSVRKVSVYSKCTKFSCLFICLL